MNVSEFFGPTGPLSRLPGYAVRDGQISMAKAIEDVMRDGGALAVEGPTGVGKTRAYSVPSILRIIAQRGVQEPHFDDEDGEDTDTRKRVVIVTAGIPLQEQIVGKDLPALAEVMPEDFTYALFKGRGNYACNLNVKTLAEESTGVDGELADLVEWAKVSATGDKSELKTEPTARNWMRLATTSDDCIGKKKCPEGERCFYEAQRRRVREADVIVCNYHVFFAHVALYMQTEKHLVLPAHDVVIFDEAHDMVDIARDYFGWRITLGSVKAILNMLQHVGAADRIDPLLARARMAFENARAMLKNPPPGYKARFLNSAPFTSLTAPLRSVMQEAAAIFAGFTGSLPDKITAERVSKADDKARLMIARLAQGAAAIDTLSAAVFMEEDREDLATFEAREVDVGEMIAQYCEERHAVIATSATLNIPLFIRESGFDKLEARTLEVPSPFAYRDNVLTIIPDGREVPEPNHPEYRDAVARCFRDIVAQAGGRTLGLFTSYRSLEAAHGAISVAPIEGVEVYRQGEAPRTALISRFRENETSVLMGTDSMWTGVDVPGPSCSVVTIDRIPFDPPDDPIQSVLKDRDPKGYFRLYSLPRAIQMLKQGFGRLIRSTSDFGVVVLFDRRIVESRYGDDIIRALPETKQSRDLRKVRSFLDWRAGQGKNA